MPWPLLASTLANLDAFASQKLVTWQLKRNGLTVQTYTMPINPSSWHQVDGFRGQVAQTEAGGQAQSFGRQLTTIRLQGVTGWQAMPDPNGGLTDGYTFWHTLKGLLDNFLHQVHTDPADTWELDLINWTDQEAWSVLPTTITLDRTAPTRGLYYAYDIELVCLSQIPPVKDPVTGIPQGQAPDAITGPGGPLHPNFLQVADTLNLYAALCKNLIVQGNVSVLSTQEQALIATYVASNPAGVTPPASQVLNAANFPGIGDWTGYDINPRPPGSALFIIDSLIYPVTQAIVLYADDRLAQIPAPYANVTAAQGQLAQLVQNIENAYPAQEPNWMLAQVSNLRQAISPLVNQQASFSG
jgi:hypothetical protein